MKRWRFLLITYVAVLLAAPLVSCSNRHGTPRVRAVYYWATTLDIDSTKAIFIRQYGISRMYLRMFDVVADDNGRSVPNATLQFASGVPGDIDIVPTVFVMPQCLNGNRTELARRIVKRVLQMCATNDIRGVSEMQIDCDWTLSTRRAYHDFMRVMLDVCHRHGLKLSSTIRLHQLAQTPPPADRGVLMMYNTGDITNPKCRKPILDTRDAAPYLPYLHDYRLPMATAYPIFSWRVLFRGGRYVGIVHHKGEYPTLTGDSIATIQPSAADILEAVRTVSRHRADANNETILFDLSNNNIQRLKPIDYEKILNAGSARGIIH